LPPLFGNTQDAKEIYNMLNQLRRIAREPLWIITLFFPLAIVFPYVPGIPRGGFNGLTWRQELIIASLMIPTLALSLKRAPSKSRTQNLFIISPSEYRALSALALFTAWIGATTFWAASPYKAFYSFLIWSMYVLFFFFICQAVRRARLMRAMWRALGASVWLLSIICMILFWGTPTADSPYPLKTIMQYFSGFSEMMSVVVMLFAALALTVRQRKAAWLCGATSVIAWLATLQGLQRAPVIGACAGLFIFAAGMIFLRRCRPRSWSRAALLCAGLVFAAALQIIPSPLNANKVSTIDRLHETTTDDANMRVRFLYWAIALEMWRERPLTGIGADNYEILVPEARARFSAEHSTSALLGMNETLLIIRPHNWFVQVLSELGIIGFLLFTIFLLVLLQNLWRALRFSASPKSALLPLGAGAGVFAFLIGSLTSVCSFMWMSGGLLFLLAAAIICRAAEENMPRKNDAPDFSPRKIFLIKRAPLFAASALALMMFGAAGLRALNAVCYGMAQSTRDPAQREAFYRLALRFDGFDASTQFNYGMFLYYNRRYAEAVPYLTYGAAHGYNDVACYHALVTAQEDAGDFLGAERTLDFAVKVYPRSVFLRLLHSDALARLGRAAESAEEEARARSLDERMARGWQQFLHNGKEAAARAAHEDKTIALPGELKPEICVLMLIDEAERRKAAALARAR
jgi:hypothetical protein